jgi:K+-sensing histidine kinase KdpD
MNGTIGSMLETVQRYGTALLGVGVTLLLILLFWPRPELATTTLLFVLPVACVSLYGGPGPGVLAAVAAGLTIDYFLLKPYAYADVDFGDMIRIAIFVLVALLLGWLRNVVAQDLDRRHRIFRGLEEVAAQIEKQESSLSAVPGFATKSK